MLYDHYTKFNINKLLPSQIATLDYLCKMVIDEKKGVLVYHGMGTGKTNLGIVFALLASLNNIVYIAVPSSNLLLMWEEAISNIYTLIFGIKIKRNHIKVVTHETFINDVVIENAIAIIDEAHRIFEKDFYSKNRLRYVLMTGTPFSNTVYSIKNIVSILTGQQLNITDRNRVFDIKLNEEDLDSIRNNKDFKVSYLTLSDKNNSTSKYMGENVITMSVIKCPMVEPQLSIVENHLKIHGKAGASIINNPEVQNDFFCVVGGNILSSDNESNKVLDFGLTFQSGIISGVEMSKLNISSKIKYMMNDILENKGKRHFVFFVNSHYGTIVLDSVFSAHGICNHKNTVNNYFCKVHWTRHGKKYHDCTPLRYVIITSHINDQIIIDTIAKYNNGDIDIICGSKIISEGYTLKNTSKVWILTIPYTPSLLDQIIARTVRQFSHDVKTVVEINMLASTMDTDVIKHSYNEIQTLLDSTDILYSFDIMRVYYLELKKLNIDEVDDIIKDIGSFDSGPDIHPLLDGLIKYYECIRLIRMFRDDKPRTDLLYPINILKDYIKDNKSILVDNDIYYYDNDKLLSKPLVFILPSHAIHVNLF